MVEGVAAITVEGDTSWLMNATIRQDTKTAVLIKISRTEFCSIQSKSGSSFLTLFLA
jgi:hypothetical protein